MPRDLGPQKDRRLPENRSGKPTLTGRPDWKVVGCWEGWGRLQLLDVALELRRIVGAYAAQASESHPKPRGTLAASPTQQRLF